MLTAAAFNIKETRKDFPMLASVMNGKPLVYLDNAATTQKPKAVIERMSRFMKSEYATIHRGVYTFSQESTRECDTVREKCRAFLNAAKTSEIIFVRGATEAINLVATSFGGKFLKKGDEIVVSEIEHHSNIVPWHALAQKNGYILKTIPVNNAGELDLDAFKNLLASGKVRFVAITHVSNALGTVNPIKEIIRLAHGAGATVLIDGAQGAPHVPVDVRDLDCDFYCFSGHKIYGPTGVGVLYGKEKLLEAMDPYQYGGDMIETVNFDKITFAKLPAKFEAGTPAIVEIIGLGAAIDYLEKIGFEDLMRHEGDLLETATKALKAFPGITLIGTAKEKASLISFELEGVHPHDVGTVLNEAGVAVRVGHHCAQPTMRRFRVPATTRASFAFYNTKEEIDALMDGLKTVRRIFK